MSRSNDTNSPFQTGIPLSRRKFLAQVGATGALVTGSGVLAECFAADATPAESSPFRHDAPAPGGEAVSTVTAQFCSRYHGVFRELPLTATTPQGWLAELLGRQRDGLGLHHAASGYPYDACMWTGVIPKGGNPHGDPWWPYEQTAYIVDGLYRCGLIMRDPVLKELGEANFRHVLDNPRPDGTLGPKDIDEIEWPLSVFTRALMAHYDATHDPKILEALTRHYLSMGSPNAFRDVCLVEGICWTYLRTGDPRLLTIAEDLWMRWSKRSEQWDLANMASEAYQSGHGVTVAEVDKLPALLYLCTGDQRYLDASLGAFHSIARDHELVDGIPSSSERLSGRSPWAMHETCDISDYTWDYRWMLLATGDGAWADKIERGVLNAGLGAIAKDFRSHQYFSSPNQVIATQTSCAITDSDDCMRQSYRPGFPTECCSGNVHRMLPNYAASLWLSDGAGGIVAAMYAPSTLETVVGAERTAASFKEITDYPFSGKVLIVIGLARPTAFSLYLHIPAWADGAEVRLNGQRVDSVVNTERFVRIERTFRRGDLVELILPMKVRVETPDPDLVSFVRGPLVYALPVETNRSAITNAPKSSVTFPAWDLTPSGPWDFAVPPDQLEHGVIKERTTRDFPWDIETTPNDLTVIAARVPGWTLTPEGRNPSMPPANLMPVLPLQQIRLVPLGATQLRVSVFPSRQLASAP